MLRPSARRSTAATALAVVAGAAAGACGDDGGDANAFCQRLREVGDAVVAPVIEDGDDVEQVVQLYRGLANEAPLAIQAEWETLALNVETAATVVPGDEESVQRAVAQAYASERAAVEAAEWARQNCGVDLGPVATVAPQGPLPTTTLPEDVGKITEEPAG